MTEQHIFQNTQVDISLLPSARNLDWQPLQRSYRQLQVLSVALWCAVLIGGITLATPFMGIPAWVPLLAYTFIIVLCALQLLFVLKGFPNMGYVLRTHDILYRRGWLYKKQIAVPFNRIQHVDIRQGLFERAYGLAKLNIYTAGGQGSDITIPGLTDERAQHLKEFILRKTTVQDEEE